jgi:hypothetical protein
VNVKIADKWRERAISVGKARFAYAERMGWRNYGAYDADVRFDIHGCVCECSVGAHFHLKWHENVGVLDGIDVGEIIEVRGRMMHDQRSQYDLPIRPRDEWGVSRDKLRLPHVLVCASEDLLTVELHGWLYGYEGFHTEGSVKHDTRWDAKSMCWWNPAPYRPLDELRAILDTPSEVARILQEHAEFEAEQAPRKAEREIALRERARARREE